MIKYIIECSRCVPILPIYFSCGTLRQFLYYSSRHSRDPYDVLGLKSTCSIKDVKEAYIKLCKELHPDVKPGDSSQHKKFVELNDAYTFLLNSKSRRKTPKRKAASNASNIHHAWQSANHRETESQKDWSSEKAWYEREEYQKYYHQHDSKNLLNKNLRKANIWVIAGCVILMLAGSILYLSAYSYATKYTKKTVDEKSKKISESYFGVRQNLVINGLQWAQLNGKSRISNQWLAWHFTC